MTLSVTFTPYPDSPVGYAELYVNKIPQGWTSPHEGIPFPVIEFHYIGSVTNGALIRIPDGIYFSPNAGDVGTYQLTFSLAGLTSSVFTYQTPPASVIAAP